MAAPATGGPGRVTVRRAVPENNLETILSALDSIKHQSLDPNEKEEIKKFIESRKELRILATGKTGVGKSSLLNGFIGDVVFEEGNTLDPQTVVVEKHEFKKRGITVTAWDCPGLQDGTENEEAYLEDLVSKTNMDIDLMIYCLNMSETKATDMKMHDSALRKLTTKLGPDIWKHTLVALTFANAYEYMIKVKHPGISKEDLIKQFNERTEAWKQKFQEALHDVGVSTQTIEAIPFQPAGHYNLPDLPGIPTWASKMWIRTLSAVSERARHLPLILNFRRFTEGTNITNEDFQRPLEEQWIIITPKDVASFGVPAGAMPGIVPGLSSEEEDEIKDTGKAIGAVAGGVALGIFSLGIFVPVGVLLGAEVGFELGTAVCCIINWYRARQSAR